ncbi:MAG: molybdopterin-dependent oxidoreductase [Burkholderiaceae bacterium]|nr:molybdopterin-dependent oxidoreductase [Burkholderiaceae bacterium]
MKPPPSPGRRDFFRRIGGGIVVLVALDAPESFSQPAFRGYPEDFNAYLVIGRDSRVTVFSGKIEMGQGVLTSQAQLVAEELGVDLGAIDMVLGDTARCPWDMGTFGSLTIRMFGPALRAAAAQARLTLITLASKRLGVPAGRLVARGGVVSVDGEPARAASYGELSQGAAIAEVVGRKAVLRAASEFSVMGRSPLRLDGVEKVTGAAKFAADIRLPGMLHARIVRPPSHDARLERIDTSGAEAIAGVSVVRIEGLVAVLHEDPETADQALERAKCDWKTTPSALTPETIFEHLMATPTGRRITLDRGDLAGARASASARFESVYRKGYVAHAPMETHTALADVRDGKATIWASTQTPFPTRDLVAQRLKMKQDDVRVITPYVGGGFGGKSAGPQAIEAALLSAATRRPVQVAFSRAEEFFYDTFDPACVVRIASSLGRDGRIATWDYEVFAAGERGSELFYDVPNARIEIRGRISYEASPAESRLHPFAVGPWRAPGANMNVFAIESQIDLMASAAREDPVAFRLKHLSNRRVSRVLEAAADEFGWTPAAAPSGRGVGVACSIDAGTCVAAIAKVEVDRRTGKVRVARIVCAQDMGIVVNPTGATMQIEGALTMGLGYTLTEELRFRSGEVLDRNFDTYALPRFRDVPAIETVLVRNDELAPQGGGEPAITVAGAVIANAVFDATGVRHFRLPITTARVLAPG